MLDEEMIENIAADISWDGFWFKCHNFFINSYFTLILLPFLMALWLEPSSFMSIFSLVILYDILWHKNRFSMRYQKARFIKMALYYIVDEEYKSRKVPFLQNIHFVLVSLLILNEIFQVNLYILMLFIPVLIALMVAEYFFIIKYMTWLTYIGGFTTEKPPIPSIVNKISFKLYLFTNKTIAMLYFFFLYGITFVMIAVMPLKQLNSDIEIMAVLMFFIMVVLAVFSLLVGALFVRMKIIERSYVQISKNIKH